jgi:hypothetical protein
MDIPKEISADEPVVAIFGLKADWLSFSQDHQVLLRKLPILFRTFEHIFLRTMETKNAADRVLLFLGRLMAEDFAEILLLCGNGYGVAGFKILRGLYERAVTAAYLAKNPEQVETFLHYHPVHMGKLLNHAAEIFDLTELFPEAKIAEIKQAYQEAKKDFQEPICEKCKTTRTQISWSRLDIGSMAKKVNPELAQLYLQCYFMPTLQTHSTASALFAQMNGSDDGELTFDEKAQRKYVDQALAGAHSLILFALDTQNVYFNLGLADEIGERRGDWVEIWSKRKTG